MADLYRWLRLLERADRIVGFAIAVTLLWLYVWFEAWPYGEGKLRALVCMLFMVFIFAVFGLLSWLAKLLITDELHERKIESEGIEEHGDRWPTG